MKLNPLTWNPRVWWLLAAGWAATIFVLSSLPGTAFPEVHVANADKYVHFTIYAFLGALCTRALRARRAEQAQRTEGRMTANGRGGAILVAAALTAAYGISDELHQLFTPGRSADVYDALADAIGGCIGATLAALI